MTNFASFPLPCSGCGISRPRCSSLSSPASPTRSNATASLAATFLNSVLSTVVSPARRPAAIGRQADGTSPPKPAFPDAGASRGSDSTVAVFLSLQMPKLPSRTSSSLLGSAFMVLHLRRSASSPHLLLPPSRPRTLHRLLLLLHLLRPVVLLSLEPVPPLRPTSASLTVCPARPSPSLLLLLLLPSSVASSPPTTTVGQASLIPILPPTSALLQPSPAPTPVASPLLVRRTLATLQSIPSPLLLSTILVSPTLLLPISALLLFTNASLLLLPRSALLPPLPRLGGLVLLDPRPIAAAHPALLSSPAAALRRAGSSHPRLRPVPLLFVLHLASPVRVLQQSEPSLATPPFMVTGCWGTISFLPPMDRPPTLPPLPPILIPNVSSSILLPSTLS